MAGCSRAVRGPEDFSKLQKPSMNFREEATKFGYLLELYYRVLETAYYSAARNKILITTNFYSSIKQSPE